MAPPPPYSRVQLVGAAILGYALTGFVAWHWKFASGVPERAGLATAQGRVAWHESDKYGVEFGLEGSELAFDYASKANGADVVRSALAHADRRVVTVLYGHEVHGPVGTDERLHYVYEIAVDGRIVRAYADVRAAWEADDAIAPWLAGIFALISTWLLWMSRRMPAAD
jgi:hypothetical protein